MHRALGISSSMLDPELPHEQLQAAADLGITHLELFVRAGSDLLDQPAAVEEVRASISEAGLELWSVHAPFGGEVDMSAPDELARRGSVDTIHRACKVAEQLGAKWVVAHAGMKAEDPEEDRLRHCQSLRSINCLLVQTAALGLELAIEYLPGEKPRLWNNSSEILEILDMLDGRPGVCLDVNHANTREPLNDVVHALGPNIGTLHISDNDGQQELHLLPGEGVIDWSGFVAALDEIGYAGPLIFETSSESEVYEHLEMALRAAVEHLGWEPRNAAGPP